MTQTHLNITGTWFDLSERDSFFNLDGSLYSGNFYLRDTSVYGYKSCNYVIIQDNDTCLAGSCNAPGYTRYPSYYHFISDSLFAEHAIQNVSPFGGFDQDTAKVIQITSSLLVLDRKVYQHRFNISTLKYDDFYVHTIDSLFR